MPGPLIGASAPEECPRTKLGALGGTQCSNALESNNYIKWMLEDSHYFNDRNTYWSPAPTLSRAPHLEGTLALSAPRTDGLACLVSTGETVRVRLTYDGTHVSTGVVATSQSINEVIISLGGREIGENLAAYPVLNNVKPLRSTSTLGDYIGHTAAPCSSGPDHHIDLRPTMKGGGRRPDRKRHGKDEVSTDEDTPSSLQEAKSDKPDALREDAGWDAAKHVADIEAAHAAGRASREAHNDALMRDPYACFPNVGSSSDFGGEVWARWRSAQRGKDEAAKMAASDPMNREKRIGAAVAARGEWLARQHRDRPTTPTVGLTLGVAGDPGGAGENGERASRTPKRGRPADDNGAHLDAELEVAAEMDAIWHLIEPAARASPQGPLEPSTDSMGEAPRIPRPIVATSVRRSARVAGQTRSSLAATVDASLAPDERKELPPIDAARSLAAQLESTWGLPAIEANWEEGDNTQGLWDEVALLRPQTGALETCKLWSRRSTMS